jgi:hypothetical protein
MLINNNIKIKTILKIVLLLVPLLIVFPNSPFSIGKAYSEANVIVTPTCGPASGFNIQFDAIGFSPNGLVYGKLVHSDGSEETNQFSKFETNGNGSFSGSTYVKKLSPDVYTIDFFDDIDRDSEPDSGGAEFLSSISIPCGYGIQQNENISSPSVLFDNITTNVDDSTLSDNTTMAKDVSAPSNVSTILARNQTSILLSNQSSFSLDNGGYYENAIINSNPLLNRSRNGVTTAASIFSDNTTLNGSSHRKLITADDNVTTKLPNQISVYNMDPNLEGQLKQQHLHTFQHSQYQQPITEEQQQILSPLPTPTYPYLSSHQNQSSLPFSPSNSAEKLEVGGNKGKDIAAASTVGTKTIPSTTPMPPIPFQQELLPSPPSLASPTITVRPLPPPTTPIPPIPFQQQLLPSPPATTSMPIPSSYLDTTPPDSVITSAIDNSTGLNLQIGGGTTASNLITLIFGGIDDSGITGYSCRIDNLPTFTCSSPIVLDNDIFLIALGISGTGSSTVHTFQVSATDIAGNTDLTPAIFNWFTINTIVPESNIQPQIVTSEETTIPSTITFPPIIAESVPPYVIGPNTIKPPLITPQAILSNTIGQQVVTPQIITPETQKSFEP